MRQVNIARVMASCAGVGILGAAPVVAGVPPYCRQIDASKLKDLQLPYTMREAGGLAWCEGQLPEDAAALELRVVSAKVYTNGALAANKPAALSWCDPSAKPAHLSLRSIDVPLYALDAEAKGSFSWKPEIPVALDKSWGGLTALATEQLQIEGETVAVIVPVGLDGSSETYVFTVQSKGPVKLNKAQLKLVSAKSPTATDAKFARHGNTVDVTIDFGKRDPGVYRLSISEPGGNITTPIYVLHARCGAHH